MRETPPLCEPGLHISDARIGPKEIAATVVGPDHRLPIELRSEQVPFGTHWADASAALMLLPGMRLGCPVELPDGVSPRLLASLPASQEILRGFDRDWETGIRPVPVSGAARVPSRNRAPGVACLFSGGVDSFYSLLKHRSEITHLLFVHGFDIPLDDGELLGAASDAVNRVADELGLQAIEVKTDLRSVFDELAIPWPHAHGAALAAVALLLQDTIGRLIVPSTFPYGSLEPWGSHPLLDPLWSTEQLEFEHDGSEATRPEKIAALTSDDLAMDHLRVCWENRGGAYNCGECEKCVRTMINLRIAGGLERCRTLPDRLGMDAVRSIPVYRRDFLVENIAATETTEQPDPELHAALVEALRRHDAGRDRPRGERHGASNVRVEPGELSFDVEIAGIERTIWFRTDAPVTPTADAALATCLLPAMRAGGTLAIDAPVSRRLLRTQDEFQAVQRVWSHDWTFGLPPLGEVDVEAPGRAASAPAPAPDRGVATFFSGGADSWATVLEHPDVTHLVFVRGMDIPVDATELGDRIESRLREAAAELGKPLYVVETNLRQLSDRLVPWEIYYGSALAAVALLLAPLFERVLMTGDLDYEVLPGQAAHPLVDHLWSTETLEIAHANARYNRVERLRLIAGDPVVQRTLRVCWKNPDGAYNCGRCRKCLGTMIALEIFGVRERFTTFPRDLDLTHLGDVGLTEALHVSMWEDYVQLAREGGRPDLEEALASVLIRTERTFEPPPSYRRRRTLDADVGIGLGSAGADDQSAAAGDLAARLDTVLGSRSWRLTRPLRELARRIRK